MVSFIWVLMTSSTEMDPFFFFPSIGAQYQLFFVVVYNRTIRAIKPVAETIIRDGII